MEGYSNHHRRSDYVLKVVNTRTARAPPSLPQECHVAFKFSCRYIFSHWILPSLTTSNRRQLIDLDDARFKATVPIITLGDGDGDDTAAERMIGEALKDWSIEDHAREELIRYALVQAREIMPANNNTIVCLHVCINAYHPTSLWDDDVDEDDIDDEEDDLGDGDDDMDGMIPCDEWLIETVARKKVVVSTDSDVACSVCLDEFVGDCETVSMPCEHVFHKDCIVDWLRTSRYCPVCRFEMSR